MSGSTNSSSESYSDSESFSESDSVADVPIFIPVPFKELSSVEYMPLDEQLHQMTRRRYHTRRSRSVAALKIFSNIFEVRTVPC